jgi:two-component system, chemotaxis family, sensor kinase CheA
MVFPSVSDMDTEQRPDSLIPSDEDPSDREIFADYLDEMNEHLERLEGAVLAMEANVPDADRQVFRLFHSLKGTAGVFGHNLINRIAHRAEDLLELARDGRRPIDDTLTELLLTAGDAIRGILAQIGPDHPQEPAATDDHATLIRRIEAALEFPAEQPIPAPVSAPAPMGRTLPADTVRFVAERLDRLVDLIGEVMAAAAQLRDDPALRTDPVLRDKADHLGRTIAELSGHGMGLRMIPVGVVFEKMRRVVRDCAKTNGREIDLRMVGGEAEIDRKIVESLHDPLLHLVRNACDHGVEPPQERTRIGKPIRGVITLHAERRGEEVVIEVTDDGRGLDREAIHRKATANGWLPADSVPADEALYALLLRPGFSTAREVTAISGRGVGLDIVAQQVAALGGRTVIESRPGQGACFRLILPLNLAIIEGMLCEAHGQVHILPVAQVEAVLHPSAGDFLHAAGGSLFLRHRGENVPIFDLATLLGYADAAPMQDPTVLVARIDNHFIALRMDRALGIREVAVRSLGPRFAGLKGVSGSTILGDGSVGLILDLRDLSPDSTN